MFAKHQCLIYSSDSKSGEFCYCQLFQANISSKLINQIAY
jgi:hypothetical protein